MLRYSVGNTSNGHAPKGEARCAGNAENCSIGRKVIVDHSSRRKASADAIGAMLLAALRTDGAYGGWSLADVQLESLPALAEVASMHAVLPLVRRALQDAGRIPSAGHSPDALLGRLDGWFAGAIASNMRVTAELETLSRLLDRVGSPWAVVKGPALAELAYARPELRVYNDLDVLVHPRAFGDVVRALENAGAVLLNQNWSFLHRRGQCEASLLMPRLRPNRVRIVRSGNRLPSTAVLQGYRQFAGICRVVVGLRPSEPVLSHRF